MAKHEQYIVSNYGETRCRVKYLYDTLSGEPVSWAWQPVRDKLVTYVNQPTYNPLRKAPKDAESQIMAQMASPSQYVLVRRIPAKARENLYKLFELMDNGLEPYQDVPDVGFFAPYRYGKEQMTFVVHAGDYKQLADRDPERDSLLVNRVKPNELATEVNWFKLRKENGIQTNMSEEEFTAQRLTTYGWRSRLCYVDRMTKVEKDRLSLLKIAPVGVYIPECGMRVVNHGREAFVLLTDK